MKIRRSVGFSRFFQIKRDQLFEPISIKMARAKSLKGKTGAFNENPMLPILTKFRAKRKIEEPCAYSTSKAAISFQIHQSTNITN